MTPTLDDYRWLVGPQAAARLVDLRSEFEAESGGELLPRLVARLRTEFSATQVHLLLEQLELRRHGREKFSRADEMFFARRTLEQATDQWVAAYKASRFPADQPVVDLCCGIGGDLLSLAERAPVLGVDRDPICGLLAETNIRKLVGERAGEGRAKIVVTDVSSVDLHQAAAWHIDPDRRPSGRRTTRVELHEPGPETIRQLLADCPHAAIKLAPAATFEEPWWREAELEWIGRARQCRQLVAWFGKLAQHPGKRQATVLKTGGAENSLSPWERVGVRVPDRESQAPSPCPLPRGEGSAVAATFVGEAEVESPFAPRIGRYVFEPDPAVLAAKLEGALATETRIAVISPGTAYFTADQPALHAALSCFEVLEVMPYRVKAVREWLAARGIGRLEIKKRGVPLDPEAVRRDLKTEGDSSATILLLRQGERVTAIVAQRV